MVGTILQSLIQYLIISLKKAKFSKLVQLLFVFISWRDVREVEGDGLEIRYVACLHRGFESLSLRTNLSQHSFGEVSEWSKVHDWKSCKVKSLRGFESPSLRRRTLQCSLQSLFLYSKKIKKATNELGHI